MKYEQAQEMALELRGDSLVIAVVFRNGETWEAGTHFESRYLESYFEAEEIHIYGKWDTEGWVVYKSPDLPVDYVAETGATGEMANRMRAMMQIIANSKHDR